MTPADEKPAHYARLDEIIKARPAFDDSCIITRENFASLVGAYSFGDNALCQVESIEAKGRPCRKKHRNGWLGRCKDGREGLIGSTCGPKYFEGHEGFAANRASVRRELDLDDLTARLGVIASDADFPARLESLRARLQTMREQSHAHLESLPEDIGARLRAMAKSRNGALRIEIEFVEQVDDGTRPGKTRTKSTWVSQTVGAVAGLSIADRAPIHDLQKGLAAVREAFNSLDPRRELGGTKLRSQLKVLESLPTVEGQLVALETAWIAFARAENLRNLWLLSRRRESQVACMRRESPKPNYVVFPECSLPRQWASGIAHKLAQQRISFIAGLEYKVSPIGLHNEALISLTTEWPWYSTSVSYVQEKLAPAHEERRKLRRLANAKLNKPQNKVAPIYVHGDFCLGVIICSDLTTAEHRLRFQGGVDALIVIEWNSDVETFDFLVESTAHDLHGYIVQVNNRQYGDSRIRVPRKKDFERDVVRVKGGMADYFVIAELDVLALRRFQRKPTYGKSALFKPLPIGFQMSKRRRSLF